MNWISLFIAALQTLTAASPAIISQFHGGAHDTATKVGSALSIVNAFTTNMAMQIHPMSGVDPATIHPDLQAHADSIAAGNPETTAVVAATPGPV